MFNKLRFPTLAILLLISVDSLWSCTRASVQQEPIPINLASHSPCFQGASAGFVRPRLTVGMTGRSISDNKLSIRKHPGDHSQVAGSLSTGDTFKVLAGPECKDSQVWWKVDNGQLQGWVAEADPATSKYWLEPSNE
jgi:uncharacterized protein YgiM (DUF1202 family)